MATLYNIDVNMWVGNHLSLISTTIYTADAGKGTDVQLWVVILLCLEDCFQLLFCLSIVFSPSAYVGPQLSFSPWVTTTIISINRIACQVTAAIEFTNKDWSIATSSLFDIHGDRTLQLTAILVTSEHALEHATGNGQTYIAFHIGILCTGINLINPLIRHTAQYDVGTTAHIGVLTTTIDMFGCQCRTAIIVCTAVFT